MPDFEPHPGYWFVAATLLPLASFVLILLASGLWCIFHRYREAPGMEGAFQLVGGDKPGWLPAYVALGAIALAFVCSAIGFVLFMFDEQKNLHTPRHKSEVVIGKLDRRLRAATGPQK